MREGEGARVDSNVQLSNETAAVSNTQVEKVSCRKVVMLQL